VLVLTGANAPFYRSLVQMLLSARRHGLLERCRVFDLGLDEDQHAALLRRFPGLDLRRFPFERYPGHVAMEAESYAWKPVIVAEALEEGADRVLWLDAATILLSDLSAIEAWIREDGQYVPIAGGPTHPIRRGIHPGTLEFLGVDPEEPFLGLRQRAGGVCGFDGGHPLGRRLALRWRDLALEPACIVPPGSHRGNHRQDQAVLQVLLHRAVRDEGLRLTDEEIDLTSVDPMPWLSTRNKLSNRIPIALDPIVWRLGWLSSRGDAARRRWRRRWTAAKRRWRGKPPKAW